MATLHRCAAEMAADPVAEIARERFGIPWLSPWQRLVIANILEGAGARPGGPNADAVEALGDGPGSATAGSRAGEPPESPDPPPSRQIVLLPTGAGKSLCFQLPALLLEGPTLVVYPLLALIEDQRRRLEEVNIPHAVLRGGQDRTTREAALARAESGEARLILANPEVLAVPAVARRLAAARLAHAAIDEAHCVVEWGETFRPAYRGLGDILGALAPRAVSAFTATAGPAIVPSLAERLFGGEDWRLVASDPDRANIEYAVLPTIAPLRDLELLARRLERPLLVFCPTRGGTELAAAALRSRLGEEDVRFYHAGLSREEKRGIEEWFMGSAGGILTATCAYGMGVDKKNIRSVVHLGLPATVEAYLQEAGRGGRDGKTARAVLLACPGEEVRALRETDPARRERRLALAGYAAGGGGCRRESLLTLLGEPGGAGGSAPPGEGRACPGCDRCAGVARERPAGLAEIRAFVEANARRFPPAAALALLAGRPGAEPARCGGRGLLSGWREEDLAEALRNALMAGGIRVDSRGAWKGRLRGEASPR